MRRIKFLSSGIVVTEKDNVIETHSFRGWLDIVTREMWWARAKNTIKGL